MPRSSTSFKPGASGNPKGRPLKKRTLTNLLEKGGNKKFTVGDEEFAAKKLFVERVWQGLATGHLTYNTPDGQPMVFPLDAQQYIALAKLVLGQVDGPPRAEVDVTSAGKELKASSSVDGMKDILQMMGQREKNVLPKIEARFNPRQLEAIERAIKRFRLDEAAAKRYFHTIYTASEDEAEILVCAGDPLYFITEYCQIYDPQAQDWIPFELWPEQVKALQILHDHQLVLALKARQVGLTWLGLAYALWLMVFRPIATILLFSKREDEAIYLLGKERLRGMYDRLPKYLQAERIEVDNATQLKLSNGSIAYSFPTTGGDSYTASYVLVDEADLVPDFNHLMRSVKPTTDAGGKLFLVSRADKDKPESEFKKIYQAAKQGLNSWKAIFLPWFIRPERTPEWYAEQCRDSMARTGSLDDMHEQYPATDIEALAGRTQNKRINSAWLDQCYQEKRPLSEAILREEKCPAIPGLLVYALPIKNRRYCAGVDPAEGNPTSDDSAAVFLDELTGEEVAMLSGKFQPSTLASYVDRIGRWLNNASTMIERNNHGHAVLLWMRDHGKVRRLMGWDKAEGWLSNSRGKALLYDGMTDCCRDKQTVIHSAKCLHQLMSIEGSTLRAPEGQMDDCSDAYALAVQARNQPRGVFVG